VSALAARTKYGEGTLHELADNTGIDYSSLRDYRRVSEAYPAAGVPRGTHCWSVCRESMPLSDCYKLVRREDPLCQAVVRHPPLSNH
jgi:hypothetical protein